MTITLTAIKDEQTRIAALIEQYEKQLRPTYIVISPQNVQLRPGEEYAGIILEDGAPSHHLILLPDLHSRDSNWQAAMDWAKSVGGELPTRREQSLLFANRKEHFEERYHWSCDLHAASSDYAWSQDFDNGYQDSNRKDAELRARAVRRLIIQ